MESMNDPKHRGQSYSVNGADNVSLKEIIELIQLGTHTNVTYSNSILKMLADLDFAFFRGLTHDKNMEKMTSQYRNEFVNFKLNDFFEKNSWTHSTRLEQFYKKNSNLRDPSLYSSPQTGGYKSVCID
jgi:hypothetical protein